MTSGAAASRGRGERMGYVGLVSRARLRTRWRAPLGLIVLLGVIGGLSLFSLAGARRVQSAYPRYLREGNASTLAIAVIGVYDSETDARIADFPEVVQSRTWIALEVFALEGGRPDPTQDFEGIGTFDGRYFDQDAIAVTAGRMPRTDRVDEVLVNQLAVDAYGYRLGQRIDLGGYSSEQNVEPFDEAAPEPVVRSEVRIVGIGLFPDEVVQDDADRSTRVLFTPAFTRRFLPTVSYSLQGVVLRRGDADIDAVTRRVGEVVPLDRVVLRVTSVDTFHAQQAIRPLSVALALFGAIAGVAAVVLVGQGIVRGVRWDRGERTVLRGLGAAPRGVFVVGLVSPAVTAVLGSLLAVALAIAASPAMPIGAVRAVEVGPGIDVDRVVLGFGALAFALVLVLVAAVALWTERRRRQGPGPAGGSRARFLAFTGRRGMSPRAVTGLRFALGSGGDGSATWSVMVGAAVAIAALVAALTFGASLRTLVNEPHLYGWNWDAAIVAGDGYGNIDPAKADELLGSARDVATWSGAYYGADRIDGTMVSLMGMEPGAEVAPPILEGRGLGADDEVVLGPATASTLGVGIGDRVTLAGRPDDPVRVVGIATFPTIGRVHDAHTSLGVGALVVPDLVPGSDRTVVGELGQDLGPRTIFVRFRSGTDVPRAIARLERLVQPIGDFSGIHVAGVQRPAEIVNSDSLGSAPVVLAGGLVVGATLSLGLALGSAVRRQRRELALLKALGFTAGDAGAAVAWQATVTTAVGLALGVPAGVLLGRPLWSLFARQLDVADQVTVPWPAIAGVIAIALVVANVVAAVPARRARRTETALLVRTE